MKFRRRPRNAAAKQCPTLIGFAGKATVDKRLLPLRMDRKYRDTLKQIESEKSAKILKRTKFIQEYKNLIALMSNLKRENIDNSNTGLLMELKEKRFELQQKLRRLNAELDCIPKNINGRKKGLGDHKAEVNPQNLDTTICEKHQSDSWTGKRKSYSLQKRIQPINSNSVRENSKCETPRKRWSGGYKSQIFVRKNKSQLQPISIDLFSSGRDLFNVLAERLGDDLNTYNVMFGTKQIDLDKKLFEQEIYHGTTIDLNIRLQGGTQRRKTKKQKKKTDYLKTSEKPEVQNPEMWTKQQVANWVSHKCKEYEIDENEVLKLKYQNGKGLDRLSKEDWIRRSENHGDLFFDLWTELKQKTTTEGITENKDILLADTKDSESSLSQTGEEKTAISSDSEKSVITERLTDVDENKFNFSSGVIRQVRNLGNTEDLTALEDFGTDGKSPTPGFGSVVSVKGVLKNRPRFIGDIGTLLIGDDPQGAASSFTALRIVIQSDEENTFLRPYTIKTVFEKMRIGTEMAIKGRVVVLEETDLEKTNTHCEMLKFKLVIDSDQHSLVYVEGKPAEFKRQLSQPHWLQKFKLGAILEKTPDMVFCDSADINEIIKYAVAFKNSFHGNILVGVKKNSDNLGEITGLDMNDDDIAKWREKLSMSIGNILPSLDDSAAAICSTKEEAIEFHEQKSFILVMSLLESTKKIVWIHVPKGEEARLYVTKSSDVHAYIRTGAETKRITDFNDLFCRLDSLGSRKIIPVSDEETDINKQYEELKEQSVCLQKRYKILKKLNQDEKELNYEDQEQEFKMIFGDDPVKTIQDKYLSHYSCGFLNSAGGSILFGVQEDENSKIGHIVGIVVSMAEREELVKSAVKTLNNFFPPVNTSQYTFLFHDVAVPSEYITKCNDDSSTCVLIRGPADEVGNKWPKFAKENFPDSLCRVVKVRPKLFCIVLKRLKDVSYDVGEVVKQFIKENKRKENKKKENKEEISLVYIPENELERLLKDLCIIEFTVKRSQYPIHMVHPIDTHVLDREGNFLQFNYEIMMHRFELGFNAAIQFDVKKFLNHVDNFRHSGNCYIMIASPFKFSETESDVYGLVVPKWALAIDFDQSPKQKGHLCQLFNEFNDLHQMERNHWVKTPQDSSLDLNPDRGICWLAARGYEEIEKSLSEPEHGGWNMSHRKKLLSLLETDLAKSIKPNYLNIVVLWDEGHENIVDSLRVILEDILAINGKRTAITIVCCTSEARRNITEKLVKPLEKSYAEIIIEERVYVAPPYVLARHLSSKLPDPYKPENEFQVPHKREYHGKSQVFPRILPKHLRQNINGFLKMMYIRHGKRNEKSVTEERRKFYSGSKITFSGLPEKIGIQRTKMEELETNFNILVNDRKSHVSMISVKVERGAGSTTMCLQFLFKHHEEYPCAQLIDIGDRLLSYIKDIYRETKLPLILFVDEEIAHLQDFFDFTKELVEYRHVNVILLFIEPREKYSGKEFSPQRKATSNARMKSASDHSIYGTCPYKEVTLRRELEDEEMNSLTEDLIGIKKEKESRLRRLRERAKTSEKLRTFVHFGLTAFGEEFLGLHDYVKYRLQKANEEQTAVLAYLSLIHVFTNSLLPPNALADFLKKKKVDLEAEFFYPDLRELLSPPGDELDSRRISFHEIAQEILKQLGSDRNGGTYDWLFIKSKSVEIAKNVLSINASTKSIDRLTRRLFVTSEYESEKFSSLIRAMTKDKHKHVARDTLLELVDVFPENTSFGAHLLAHLAKYYMLEFGKFEIAIPKIEKAVKNQKDDSLLRHIHGDIIRIHVQSLKNKSEIDLPTIVKHAIQSSDCFAFVRRKRPFVSHGYISDAMVRITVMQAAIKEMGGEKKTSFIDYLIQMIDEVKETSKYRLLEDKRYLLSLIPDVHHFLNEGFIDPDHKEKWKSEFRKCIGKLENLRRLCDKIQKEKNFFERDDSTLLHQVALQILILNNSLEIESKPLNSVQIENLVKEVFDPDSSRTITDQQMKFWLRHCRRQKNVPNLEEIRKQVKSWLDMKKGFISPDAEFYNYVINIMIAMKDPKDAQKRENAERIIKRQQGKKHKRKEDSVLPIEWLCPKDKHHINSIDSLLHHDDLVKETNKQDGNKKMRDKKQGRDVIEGFLFEKNIIKWEGTVKEIQRDWQGTIVFKGHFEVRFVPQNVQPSMPSTGDTVRFCLSFDRLGLMAWAVIRAPQNSVPLSILDAVSSEEESCTESDDENEEEAEVFMDSSLFNQAGRIEPAEKAWEDYHGQRMQGLVITINSEKGYGTLEHPNVPGNLFFHASQLFKPVKSLKGKIWKYMVLEFKVEKLTERTRAADIHVLTEKDRVEPAVARLRDKYDKKHSSPSTNPKVDHSIPKTSIPDAKRWEEGVVVRLSKGQDFGFITPDSKSYGKDIFFHRRNLVNKEQLPHVGDRVHFYASKRKKGYEANEVRVQNLSAFTQKWDQLTGIQEGFVDSISDDGGFIISGINPNLGYLSFYNKDVLGGAQIAEGTKVHFKVQRRKGKSIAVQINVIGYQDKGKKT